VASTDDKKRQKENLDQLKDEAEGRDARIKKRREHQQKLEAERKRKKRIRMAKMAVFWFGIFAIGLYALTWFSKDFVSWLHRLVN
jgi:hypothetical protein